MKNEKNPVVPIPAGALLTITTGIYSDYNISGVFRARVEIDTDELLSNWFGAHPIQSSGYRFDDVEFLASISHMLEPVECYEFHLSNDGQMGEHTVEKIGE